LKLAVKYSVHSYYTYVLIITSRQVATLPVCLIFAIVLACGLHFRPFEPQLGLRPRYTK